MINGDIQVQKIHCIENDLDLSDQGYKDSDAAIIAMLAIPTKVFFKVREKVLAQWKGKHFYKAIIQSKTDKGYLILYPEYLQTEEVMETRIKKKVYITILNLNRNEIGDVGARVISESLERNTSLTDLKLEANNIGDRGAQFIGKALEKNSTLKN
eukprot:TRINITY_DN4427_c0_g1_i1.p1 TRINITY_DN4427_c0_g1~~TRINITY_DN4427_c0_g1_i1.p1  ORF type:complete len:155 (-),score=16.25 TRINITY_DN4427_c0_g1_i1:47-511(-)